LINRGVIPLCFFKENMSEQPETEGLHIDVEVNNDALSENIRFAVNSLIGDGTTKTDDGKVTDFKRIIADMALQWYLGVNAGGYHKVTKVRKTTLPLKNPPCVVKHNSPERKKAIQMYQNFLPTEDEFSKTFWDNDHFSNVLYHYFAFLQEDINEAVKAVEEENPEKRANIISKIKKEKTRTRKKEFLKMISTKSGEYCMTREGGCEQEKMMTLLVLTNPFVLKCLMSDLEEKDRGIMKYSSNEQFKWLRTNDKSMLKWFDFLAIHRTWNFVLFINLTFLFSKTSLLIQLGLSRTEDCESDGMINEFSEHSYLKRIWDYLLEEYFDDEKKKVPVWIESILIHYKFVKVVTDKVPKRKREESSSSMNEGESKKRKREEEGSSSMNEGGQSSSS
jgi:hypothetical protein